MVTRITTALSGCLLREYAKSMAGRPRVAIFPETGLSAAEQAQFMELNVGKFEEVITFSSFIISDAEVDCLQVLGAGVTCGDIKHGDSVNRVTMMLGQRFTIGNVANAKLVAARSAVDASENADEVTDIVRGLGLSLGDSVEKILLVKLALDKLDCLRVAR